MPNGKVNPWFWVLVAAIVALALYAICIFEGLQAMKGAAMATLVILAGALAFDMIDAWQRRKDG